MRAVNIQGEVFGRLTAVQSTDLRRFNSVVWECQCSCGNTSLAAASKLRSGNVQSCGCLQKEKGELVGKAYGASNMWKLRQKPGTQTKHKKAGGTNRAKALLKRLTCGSLLLLLSCGVVEAQQDLYTDCIHKAPDGKTYDICRMPDMRQILDGQASPKATEPNPKMWYVDPQLGAMFTSPCEQKLKEAMKEIDEILRLNHGLLMDRDPGQPRMCLNLSQHAYRQWERVMKECVQ